MGTRGRAKSPAFFMAVGLPRNYFPQSVTGRFDPRKVPTPAGAPHCHPDPTDPRRRPLRSCVSTPAGCWAKQRGQHRRGRPGQDARRPPPRRWGNVLDALNRVTKDAGSHRGPGRSGVQAGGVQTCRPACEATRRGAVLRTPVPDARHRKAARSTAPEHHRLDQPLTIRRQRVLLFELRPVMVVVLLAAHHHQRRFLPAADR